MYTVEAQLKHTVTLHQQRNQTPLTLQLQLLLLLLHSPSSTGQRERLKRLSFVDQGPGLDFAFFCFFQILALSSSEPFQAPRSLANHAAQASTKPVSWTSPIVLIHFFSLLLCWSFRAILHMYISCCRHARSHTPSLSLSPCPLWL